MIRIKPRLRFLNDYLQSYTQRQQVSQKTYNVAESTYSFWVTCRRKRTQVRARTHLTKARRTANYDWRRGIGVRCSRTDLRDGEKKDGRDELELHFFLSLDWEWAYFERAWHTYTLWRFLFRAPDDAQIWIVRRYIFGCNTIPSLRPLICAAITPSFVTIIIVSIFAHSTDAADNQT